MASMITPVQEATAHPLDLVEQIVQAQAWPFDRFDDDELAVGVAGRWCEFHLCFSLRPEIGVLQVSASFDLKISPKRRDDVLVLFGLLNERIWLGHFELCTDSWLPVYRHAMPLREAPGMTSAQLEDLIDMAIYECERAYPALQFVLWGGQSPDTAVAAALLETQGEA